MLSHLSRYDQVLVEGGAWPAQRTARDTIRAAVADLRNAMELPSEERPVRDLSPEPYYWPPGIPRYHRFANRLPESMSVEHIVLLRKECLGGYALLQLTGERRTPIYRIVKILQDNNPMLSVDWDRKVRLVLQDRLRTAKSRRERRLRVLADREIESYVRTLITAGKL